jgi:pimeloyl-ACP methyl ester carboxylesterase
VNGIKLYHEIYGQGEPLVLLHGGLMTIGEMLTPLEPVAKTHKVIAVELQGHGRTADTDRPLSFETMGDDIAALLNQLNISKADIVGLSLGAAVGLRTAIQHPEKVRRLVVISSPYAKSGWYPEPQEGMGKISAAMAENMMQTPTGKFSKQWPEPQRFPQFLDKMGKMMGASYDWSADVKKLPMPVMLVFADDDSVSQKHIEEFFALLGGGRSPAGRTPSSRRRGSRSFRATATTTSRAHPNLRRSLTNTWPIHRPIPPPARRPPPRWRPNGPSPTRLRSLSQRSVE